MRHSREPSRLQKVVSIDADAADVYRSASDDERRKLDLLINLRLHDATESKTSLRTIMEDISREAQRRGLTPEILQSILGEEGSAQGDHDGLRENATDG